MKKIEELIRRKKETFNFKRKHNGVFLKTMENKKKPSVEEITLEDRETCTRMENKGTTLGKKIVSLQAIIIKYTECN